MVINWSLTRPAHSDLPLDAQISLVRAKIRSSLTLHQPTRRARFLSLQRPSMPRTKLMFDWPATHHPCISLILHALFPLCPLCSILQLASPLRSGRWSPSQDAVSRARQIKIVTRKQGLARQTERVKLYRLAMQLSVPSWAI